MMTRTESMASTFRLSDSTYPYQQFIRDRGWKYEEEQEKEDAYLRELCVRQNKLLNEDAFLAEAGERYWEAGKKLYPELYALARAGKITARTLFNYARYLWCMKNPDALLCVQVGNNQWEVNTCDTEIPEEKAVQIVCRDWGFDEKRVHIQDTAYYESTDWNYIRFQCGLMNWLMCDGDLKQVYN